MAFKASRSVSSLLLAAVTLLAALAAADTELTSSYSLRDVTYSSFTYSISEGIPRQRVPVDVELSASNVTGGGLILVGWKDNSEHGEYAFTMKMTNFYLDDSTFIVRDGIPADGVIIIDSLQAINDESQASPFDLSGLYFTHNLTLSIVNTFVVMEGKTANLPIIVTGGNTLRSADSSADYYTSVQVAALQSTGGSYVMQMLGTGSAQDLTALTNHALVSLSNAHCCGLQKGVVGIKRSFSLSENSYFRIRDVLLDRCTDRQTGDTALYRVPPTVLDEESGSISVGTQSVLVLQDIVARDSTVLQGTPSASTELAIGDDSTVSMINITATSLCTTCPSGLPTSKAGSSRLYASDWTLGGTTTTDYSGAGLGGATALNSAGRDGSGTCGSRFCLPGNTAGAPSSACACTCKKDTFLPACQDKQDVSGTINACSDENCVACSSSQDTCDKCRVGFVYDTSSAQCVRLPCNVANCVQCAVNNADRCEQCRDGYAVVNGQCEQCADAGCADCSEDIGACKRCFAGYSLVDGKCVATNALCKVPNCVKCKDNAYTQCEQCMSGYHLTSTGSCTPCVEPNCILCDSDANKCEACKGGYFLTSYGTCSPGPCDVLNCKYCDPNDRNGCTTCIDGYVVNSENGQCVPLGTCLVPNCLTCQSTSPNICATCASGYKVDSATGQCVAVTASCAVAKCLVCVSGNPNACAKCMAGYYVTATKKCGVTGCLVYYCAKCRSGRPDKCATCRSGYGITTEALCVKLRSSVIIITTNATFGPVSLLAAVVALVASAVAFAV